MRALKRFFVESLSNAAEHKVLHVSGKPYKHLRASRVRVGEKLEVFDSTGVKFTAELISFARDAASLKILVDQQPANAGTDSSQPLQRDSSTVESHPDMPRKEGSQRATPDVSLAVAMPKGPRADWLVEKVTELGAHNIIPIETTRSVIRIDSGYSDERLARWRRLITSAAEQSRTPRMPTLVAPRTIPALIEDALQGSTKFDSVVYGCLPTDVEFAPQHASRFATSVKLPPKRLLICVGPEGGFTVDEKESLRSSLRAVAVFSSTNQLRVETAALSLVTIFANSWG